MDKPISNKISSDSFEKLDEYIYERDISHRYNLIEKKKLEKQYEFLVSELQLVNNEIDGLKNNIKKMKTLFYLKTNSNTSDIMIIDNNYGIKFFQVTQTIKKIKEDITNSENERNLLLLDIENTENLLKEVNCKIKDYFL